jgi:Ca2+-transporting ATPase
MMIVAFVAGLALQLFVISVPGVQSVFSTTALSWQEWLITVALSVSPLIAHEIIVFVKFLMKKFNKKEN